MQEQEFYSESQEHVSNSYANYADNTDIAASLELKESIGLLLDSFRAAEERIKNSRNARRKLYILHRFIVPPNFRTDRKEVAALLGLKIFTLDKTVAYCRRQLQKACESNDLPPDAFENFISALANL